MAANLEQPLELTEQEIIRMTGYRQAIKQVETLTALGIPARKRPDNTVLVLRVHCLYPVAPVETPARDRPRLKPVTRKK